MVLDKTKGSAIDCAIDHLGFSDEPGSWKTIPSLLRSCWSSDFFVLVMSLPATMRDPDFIGSNPIDVAYKFVFSDKDGNVIEYTNTGLYSVSGLDDRMDIIEHLPDCTGFDWVPPKRPDAPEGWRWLEDDEEIQDGDCYWAKKYNKDEFADDKI
jgi:hypothetical protein